MISKSFFSFKRNEEPNQRKNAILITLDPKHKHQFEFWRQKWSWCIFHLRVLENASEASFLVKSDPKRETGRPNVESNSSRVRRSNITMGAKKVYFVIACVELYTFSRNSSAAVSENSMCFPTLILPHFQLKN